MLRIKLTRKARFKSALALVGMTQTEWAQGNGITAEHLSMVISDTQDRESKALEDKIDAFIEAIESQVAA
jgi:DNA transposition AAA+ family ATPase